MRRSEVGYRNGEAVGGGNDVGVSHARYGFTLRVAGVKFLGSNPGGATMSLFSVRKLPMLLTNKNNSVFLAAPTSEYTPSQGNLRRLAQKAIIDSEGGTICLFGFYILTTFKVTGQVPTCLLIWGFNPIQIYGDIGTNTVL